MSDETKGNDRGPDQATAKDGHAGKTEVLDEVAELTRRLARAVERTWDSEQRRAVQSRVADELRTAGEHVERLAQTAQTTKVGQELTANAEKIGRQLGEGLLAGLKALNRELSRTLERTDRDGGDEPGK